MSPRPRREERRPDLQNAIKDAAWKQIAEFGAAALNLRAIARSLGITAPSIYNYFPNRDALVTALIVDAFTSLGDSQRLITQAYPADQIEDRFVVLGMAYRNWALDYDQRYQLIFGTPIPGYHAPEEVTLPAAAQALLPLVETLQAIYESGQLRLERLPKGTPRLNEMLENWGSFVQETGTTVNGGVLYVAYVVWARVHGLVTLEIGHQNPSFITDPGEVFRREVNDMKQHYIGH